MPDQIQHEKKKKRMRCMLLLSLLLLACAAIPPTLAPTMTTLPTAQESSEHPPPVFVPTPTEGGTATPSATPTNTPVPITLDPVLSTLGYVLPLTVRHVTETSALLLFELSAPSEGILLYWPVEGEVQDQIWLPLSPGETRHVTTLEGLTPGAEYQVAVGLYAGPNVYQQPHFMNQVWGPVTFRTASGREPLRIGVVGDSGFGDQTIFNLVKEMASYELDFVLHTGDVVYKIYDNTDPVEAFALKYYTPFAPLLKQMPVYPVVGNHDVEVATYWQGTPFYYYAFPPFTDPRFKPSDYEGRNQWYAFAYGRFQFLILDTQTFLGEAGRSEQDAWVAERLTDDRFDYTIPVFHVPPFTSGYHGSDGLVVRLSWVPLFESASVPIVFSGHDHNYERLSVNGTTYIVSGGGSPVLYDAEAFLPESITFARRTHFVLVEIYADRIELNAIALGGELLDQVAIPLD